VKVKMSILEKPIRLIACGCVMLLAPGCVLWPMPDTPGVEGKVVSAATGEPVAGASVGVVQAPTSFVRSAADGSFKVPMSRRWELGVLMGDVFMDAQLQVRAEGFEDHEQSVSRAGYGNVPLTEPIRLKRK
jgi:hypothetical protein